MATQAEPNDNGNKSVFWDHVEPLTIAVDNATVPQGKIRIVCISDTHNRAEELQVPDGDILIHAGDFTHRGGIADIVRFNNFLSKLPHKHKIVIAGNHELSFGYYDNAVCPSKFHEKLGDSAEEHLRKEVYHHGWAYNAHEGEEIKKIWDKIPYDTDVLITHGPPLGIGDMNVLQQRCGCKDLYEAVSQRVKPKLHVFGHIHEGYGLYTDGSTIYANASSCKLLRAQPLNLPICVDIDSPLVQQS